jgi:O-antigen/teichoic acid export membrane protein
MTDHSDWLRPLSAYGSVRKASVRALAIVGASQAIKLLLNIAGTLLLVRLLTPADFGLAAMAAMLVNLAVMFRDFGLGTSTTQSTTLTQVQVSTVFWIAQVGGIAFTFMAFLGASSLAFFFGEPELTSGLMLLSLSFFFSTLGSQHTALLSRELRFFIIGLVEITALILGLVVAIAMALWDYGWWSLIWQRAVQIVASAIGLWLACSWRPSACFDFGSVKSQLSLGMHVSGANVAGYVSRNADNVLIGWYWGPTLLGYYAKAYDLLVVPLAQVAGPLGQVLQPALSRISEDPIRYSAVMCHALTASLLALLPVGTLMMWQPEVVTRVVFGDPWLPAAPVVRWFGVSVCIGLVGSVLGWSLTTRRRGRDLSRTAWINTSINLVGFLLSVSYGIAVVAATYALIGLCIRTPYLFLVATGDHYLPRYDALKAIFLPVLVLAILSGVNIAFSAIGGNYSLSGWAWLLSQIALGYATAIFVVIRTDFGRYIFQSVRLAKF